MINGSFGVGKTTVARVLQKTLLSSSIYDPEFAGVALMRAGKWLKLKPWQTDDFQNIPLWRRSVGAGVRIFSRLRSGPVIVPMTFSCRETFDEVVSDLRRKEVDLRLFCLTASLVTIENRLAQRRLDPNGEEGVWVARRVKECVEAHRDSYFGEPIDTEGRSASDVADDILRRLSAADVSIQEGF
jgi:predicted kinase